MKKIIIGLALAGAAMSANAGWFKSFIREITHPFSGSFAEKVLVNPAAKMFGNEFAHTYIGGLNLTPGLNGDSNLFNPWSPDPVITSFSVSPTSPVDEPPSYLLYLAGGAVLAFVYIRRAGARKQIDLA